MMRIPTVMPSLSSPWPAIPVCPPILRSNVPSRTPAPRFGTSDQIVTQDPLIRPALILLDQLSASDPTGQGVLWDWTKANATRFNMVLVPKAWPAFRQRKPVDVLLMHKGPANTWNPVGESFASVLAPIAGVLRAQLARYPYGVARNPLSAQGAGAILMKETRRYWDNQTLFNALNHAPSLPAQLGILMSALGNVIQMPQLIGVSDPLEGWRILNNELAARLGIPPHVLSLPAAVAPHDAAFDFWPALQKRFPVTMGALPVGERNALQQLQAIPPAMLKQWILAPILGEAFKTLPTRDLYALIWASAAIADTVRERFSLAASGGRRDGDTFTQAMGALSDHCRATYLNNSRSGDAVVLKSMLRRLFSENDLGHALEFTPKLVLSAGL